MTLQEMKTVIPTLSHEERKELLELLVDTFTQTSDAQTQPKKRSLRELRGLGKEIWVGVDPQDYINELRDEWDRPL